MNWLFTWLMLITVLLLIGWGLLRSERIYQFPFLVGVITFSFIMPQIPALADDHFLPEGAYVKTIAFSILCLIMCWLGWAPNARPFRFLQQSFDEKRLLVVSLLLSVTGAYFYYKLSRLPGDVSVGVQMSGAPVAWLFFARFMTYGLAIAVLCFARRFSWIAALIIVVDLVFYLDRILVTGKRAEAVELIAIFVLAFWFHRAWIVPRAFAVAGIAIGMLLMSSMSDYRDITRANSGPIWEDISHIDIAANFDNLLKDGGPEMHNAVLRIYNTDMSLEFDYGMFHWNRLVFNYVPAQLVGDKLKNALMAKLPSLGREYSPLTGTTETGMADAFQSFWYFGALKFLLLSYLVRKLWVSANAGATTAQIVYMLSIVPAMHAISHQTDWALIVWVHMIIFLVPALAWARRPTSHNQHERFFADAPLLQPHLTAAA
ncbi:hypothetical protein [Phyllobacterium myrsinacearum]|uniref:Oligosaccharide repeat unit polymerase n=1 Tax=Phyllobacterium myrsinacearum TaxID=28101 RepID=A0A839EL10_9HYPH|nr:hypothetical protein [Phyllobacterium myrsinacearum]MBA8878915.1 hypothetical protein [Phyllobacterium myrsinacearum]